MYENNSRKCSDIKACSPFQLFVLLARISHRKRLLFLHLPLKRGVTITDTIKGYF